MGRNRKRKNNHHQEEFILEQPCKFSYTIRLEAVLLDIADNISFAIIGSHLETNPFGYGLLDISDDRGKFKVYKYKNRKAVNINIETFIDEFFEGKFTQKEIDQFSIQYNKRLAGVYDNIDYTLVDVTPYRKENFEYKPTDIAYTFNSLCYKTYPFGTEHKILQYIPIPLIEDEFGNYYIQIGESDTMFTSHFDSACREHTRVKLFSFEKEGNTFITSDGKTILSADDKSGVTIMLYMIENKIPGLYYFFIGEERGGIGSGMVANHFDSLTYLHHIKKCISFDRRNYFSIITHQSWTRTCSDAFANSLCDELNKYGLDMKLDDTGMFTDSANFIEFIPECTNISVGYFNEHTSQEYQNLTFLESLSKACVQVEWEKLTISRNLNPYKEILDKNIHLLTDFKELKFYNEVKVLAIDERGYIQIKTDVTLFKEMYEDIESIFRLYQKNNVDPYMYFVDDKVGNILINIELL